MDGVIALFDHPHPGATPIKARTARGGMGIAQPARMLCAWVPSGPVCCQPTLSTHTPARPQKEELAAPGFRAQLAACLRRNFTMCGRRRLRG